MTRIFDLVADTATHGRLVVVDDHDLDLFIDGFDTTPMAHEWRAPAVRHRPPQGERGEAADLMSLFGNIPVLSGRAVDCLGPMVAAAGELLPLTFAHGEYFALNVLEVEDILDEERSDGRWFEPGRLMDLRRLEVREDWRGPVRPVFKLPQWRKGGVLVTDEFVTVVKECGLTGVATRELGEVRAP